MPKIRKLIQERPSEDVEFYSPGEITVNKINEYVSAGKTTGLETTISIDNLVKTMTIEFTTEEDFINYVNEDTILTSAANAIEYLEDNEIAFSLEDE